MDPPDRPNPHNIPTPLEEEMWVYIEYLEKELEMYKELHRRKLTLFYLERSSGADSPSTAEE